MPELLAMVLIGVAIVIAAVVDGARSCVRRAEQERNAALRAVERLEQQRAQMHIVIDQLVRQRDHAQELLEHLANHDELPPRSE